MPVLTIIIPVYKAEKYIKQCIDSILQQTYENFELILVDDGSPDQCPLICDYYARKDRRIKVLHQTNKGPVAARKAGLLAASGEYVTYVDADDYIDKNMYSVLISEAKSQNADIIICGYLEEDGIKAQKKRHCLPSGTYCGSKMQEIYEKALYFGKFYCSGIVPALWNKLIKKEILLRNQLNINENIRMGEDAAVVYPSLAASNCVVIKNEFYPYHYRVIPGTMSRKYDECYFERIGLLLKGLRSNPDIISKESMEKTVDYYALFLIEYGINSIFNKESYLNYKQRKKIIINLTEEFKIGEIIERINLNGVSENQKRDWKELKEKKFNIYIFRKYIKKIKRKLKMIWKEGFLCKY